MTNEMIVAMATDLNIRQFANENRSQFINRLLYSAMACWIKTAALDHSVSFYVSPNQGVSRRHILDRCNSILTEMLRRFPTSKPWFETKPGNETAIQPLRSRLIRHGDLLNIGFQTNVTLAPESTTLLAPDLECGKGYLLDRSFFYSGIAMLRRPKTDCCFEESNRIDSCEWFRNYMNSMKPDQWKSVDNLESLEYFNPFCKARSNDRCWQNVLPTPVEDVVLARRRLPVEFEYFLIKPGENAELHRINEFFQETKEYRRFQFALRKIADNSLVTDAIIDQDHVHLKLHFYLPKYESSLLESFAWPCNSISDKLEWNMVSSIWPYIKIHLEKLGIIIREETVNGLL